VTTDLPPTLRTAAVARAAGVNQETLRYYERRGLLEEPARSPGGHRLYPPETVTVLRIIKAAQRLGFTLDEVAELLEVGRHRHGGHNATGLRTKATAKLAEVESRIEDLHVIRARLASALEAGSDDLLTCAESACCPLPFSDIAVAAEKAGELRELAQSRR
jgi:MerR family mercuric resistance operon transcriptional regulator